MADPEALKKAVSAATDEACVNQRQLAARVGVTPLALSYWRTGRRKPTSRNVMELGRVLLEHARALEREAHELMRLAQEEELRHGGSAESEGDSENLELFDREGGIS